MTQDYATKSLKNLLPKFISELENLGRSPATVLAYRSDLGQLVEFLVKLNISEAENVSSENLDKFRDTLLAEKYTPKSVSRKLNAIKTFFKWMHINGIVATDFSKDVSHPKIEINMPKFLTPLEYRALRDATRNDTRIYAMVELTLQTGIRISELASLKLRNFKNDVLIIDGYASQPERTIPLNSAAKDAIDKYLAERPKIESEYLFISKTGKPLAVRNIRASIDRYIQKAELPKYSVNDLRTTFIIENLKNEVDIVLISQAAGHKRISTTEKYLPMAGVKSAGRKQTLSTL